MNRLRALVMLFTVCGFSCLLSARAAADPAAQARFHDELARAHYAAQRYEEALREFFLEQRISPNPRIAFNIALCFRELRRPEAAFLYFNEYLSSDDDDPKRRAFAERTIQALVPGLALVLIESEPKGATIYIDRKEHGSYGQTPTVVAIAPGDHAVTLELQGYRPVSAKVAAHVGQKVEVSLRPERILGELRVQAGSGGTISVRTASGEAVAAGPTPFATKLPPGTYEVSVRVPGSLPWTGLAEVEPDKSSSIVAAPQPLPAASGAITVTSNVPGALVELNGQPAGFTPTVLSNVSVGKHAVRVHSPSRLAWQGTLNVGAEQQSWVTVSLQEPPTIRRSTATWVAGGLAVASLAAAGVFGFLAAQAHHDFEDAPLASDRSALRERGLTLNAAADVSLLVGAAAAGTTAFLYWLTAERRGEPSSALVARSKK